MKRLTTILLMLAVFLVLFPLTPAHLQEPTAIPSPTRSSGSPQVMTYDEILSNPGKAGIINNEPPQYLFKIQNGTAIPVWLNLRQLTYQFWDSGLISMLDVEGNELMVFLPKIGWAMRQFITPARGEIFLDYTFTQDPAVPGITWGVEPDVAHHIDLLESTDEVYQTQGSESFTDLETIKDELLKITGSNRDTSPMFAQLIEKPEYQNNLGLAQLDSAYYTLFYVLYTGDVTLDPEGISEFLEQVKDGEDLEVVVSNEVLQISQGYIIGCGRPTWNEDSISYSSSVIDGILLTNINHTNLNAWAFGVLLRDSYVDLLVEAGIDKDTARQLIGENLFSVIDSRLQIPVKVGRGQPDIGGTLRYTLFQ